jgi:ribosomal protein S18 acetylase RimI-like enzyme
MSPISLFSSQLKPVAQMMARAFDNDPYYAYVIPDADERSRILPWLFERLFRYGQQYGHVFITDSMEGAAMSLTPNKTVFRWTGAIRTGLILFPLKLSRISNARIQVLDGAVDRLHAGAVTGRHWYLLLLGVDPACQGKGIGGSLLKQVLDMADCDHLPCFLDTNNENNLPFYEHYGFRVAGQERPHPDGPFVWGLIRDGN